MFRSNLLKKLFAGLSLGLALSLPISSLKAAEPQPQLSPPVYSSRTAPLLKEKYRVKPDQADIDISVYLEKNCKDNKERAIIYVLKTRKIEDISVERSDIRVTFPEDNILEKRLLVYKNIIFAHSHIVALSTVFDPKDPIHKKAFERFGEYRLRRRIMGEIPSVGENKDFNAVLYTLYNAYSKVKTKEEKEQLNLDCRIVVLDRWVDPRVLSYGVNKKLLGSIKDFDYTGSFGSFSRNISIHNELDFYKDILIRYQETHADIFELSDKPDPSFPEFADLVNKNTNFVILDHGYIRVK